MLRLLFDREYRMFFGQPVHNPCRVLVERDCLPFLAGAVAKAHCKPGRAGWRKIGGDDVQNANTAYPTAIELPHAASREVEQRYEPAATL